MGTSKIHFALALLCLLVLALGCGPVLIVKTSTPARVYLRPGTSSETGEPVEIDIGNTPTDWEIPESLLGTRVTLFIHYLDGEERTSSLKLLQHDDTKYTAPAQASLK